MGVTADAATAALAGEASVFLAREGRKVRRTFAHKAEAESWRADAKAAANRGALRPTPRDTRTLTAALVEFVEGMKAGTVRPKNRSGYKPNTIRSYDRAVKNYIEASRLGMIKVGDVQRPDVQEFADELLAWTGTWHGEQHPQSRAGVLPAGDRPRPARPQPGGGSTCRRREAEGRSGSHRPKRR